MAKPRSQKPEVLQPVCAVCSLVAPFSMLALPIRHSLALAFAPQAPHTVSPPHKPPDGPSTTE